MRDLRALVRAQCGRFVVAALAAALWLGAASAQAQRITLEALRRDGYGEVQLERPRPNVLTVAAKIDGRSTRLLVDTGWGGAGISLHRDAAPKMGSGGTPVSNFNTGSRGGVASNVQQARAESVLIGNVQLNAVPIFFGSFEPLREPVMRRAVGASGIVGAEFLRTCSAVVDLQNLRMYLRPPGKGRRAILSRAIADAGLATVPFEQTGQNDCVVDVEVNGHRGRMFVDTGAYHAVADVRVSAQINAKPVVTRRGHSRPQTSDDFTTITRMDARSSEAAALVQNAPTTPIDSFKIGDVPARAESLRLRRLPFYTGPGKPMGLLGVDILGANGTIIDFAERKLYFIPLR
jgi:predicted aspartyl protease